MSISFNATQLWTIEMMALVRVSEKPYHEAFSRFAKTELALAERALDRFRNEFLRYVQGNLSGISEVRKYHRLLLDTLTPLSERIEEWTWLEIKDREAYIASLAPDHREMVKESRKANRSQFPARR